MDGMILVAAATRSRTNRSLHREVKTKYSFSSELRGCAKFVC